MASFSDIPDYYVPHTFTKPVIIVPDRPEHGNPGHPTVVPEPKTGLLVLFAAVLVTVRFMKWSKKANRI